MKKLVYIVSFVFLMIGCKEKPIYELKINILQKETSFHYNDSSEVYSAKFILKNNTKDTLDFWTMNCSWDSSFIFNSDSIGICTWDCDKNIFELIKVPPKHSKKWKSNIWIKSNTRSSLNKKFKIGFIISKKENIDWYLTRIDTIWSEPIKFN